MRIYKLGRTVQISSASSLPSHISYKTLAVCLFVYIPSPLFISSALFFSIHLPFSLPNMPVDRQVSSDSLVEHAFKRAMAIHARAAHESPLHIAHGRLAETWDDVILGLPMGHSSSRFVDEPDHARDHELGISVGQYYAPYVRERDEPFGIGRAKSLEDMMHDEEPREGEASLSYRSTTATLWTGYGSSSPASSSSCTLDGNNSSSSEGDGLSIAFASGLNIQSATKSRASHERKAKYSPYPQAIERRLRLRMDDLLNPNGRLDRRMVNNAVPASRTIRGALATPVSGDSSPSTSDPEQEHHRCVRRTVRQVRRCACSDSEREEIEELGREGDLEDFFSEDDESDWDATYEPSSDGGAVTGEDSEDMQEDEDVEWDDYLQEFRPRFPFRLGAFGGNADPRTSDSTAESRRDGRRSSFTAM